MANQKRTQSAQHISSKKKKMAAEWETVAQSETDTAFNNEVMEVMRGLVANPSKLGAVKVALYGVDTSEEDERRKRYFPSTYVYLWKVPKDHLLNSTLPKISSRLSTDNLLKLCKVDRTADKKLLYFACASHSKQKIWAHEKNAFDEYAVRRSNMARSLVDSIMWDPAFNIDWHNAGFYVLEPPLPANVPPNEHVYTSVRCRALVGDGATVLGGIRGARGDFQGSPGVDWRGRSQGSIEGDRERET